MLGARGYKTKKSLKEAVGSRLRYEETSMFGEEYKSTGTVHLVGPNAYNDRRWYATVTLADDVIVKVV